jgi:hypothetical protein
MNNETDVLLELHERVAEARREVEHWQREYVSACAREDEQRKLIGELVPFVSQELERWEPLNYSDAAIEKHKARLRELLARIAKLEELQR